MSNEATAAAAAVSTWDIDPAHTHAQFKVRHMMISNVKGEFTKITGSVKLDSADITRSSVDVAIDVNSLNTRDAQRDGHLKSPDFFDAANYPSITFKSTKIARTEDGIELTGDVTIRGVTRPVTFVVDGPTPETKDPWGNTRVGVEATTTIDRKDFGLTWNAALETGGVLVGDKVAITVDAELVKK
ncbi:MAG TPA: YceI family protein [Bryobacteraceae bacterium]|nr:YceI family protein [Bryobacteraceae bacterium]